MFLVQVLILANNNNVFKVTLTAMFSHCFTFPANKTFKTCLSKEHAILRYENDVT